MRVNFEGAIIGVGEVGGKNKEFFIHNKDGCFKVYWCDNIKHYKIEKIK